MAKKPTVGEKIARRLTIAAGNILGGGGQSMNRLSQVINHIFDSNLQDIYGPHTPSYISPIVIEAMLRDDTIGLAMRARTSILASADIVLQVPGEQVMEQFLQDQFEEHRQRILSVMFRAIEYGNVGVENTWQNKKVNVRYLDKAGLKTRRLSNAFVISEFRDREPTETSILIDDAGDFAGLVIAGIQKLRPQCALFTHNLKFGRLEGMPGCAPAYWPWKWRNEVIAYMVGYFKTKGDPPIKVFAPSAAHWAARVIQKVNELPEEIRAQLDEIDPVEFSGAVMRGLRSGGIAAIPSEIWQTEDGVLSALRMFDIEPLQVQDREDEFVKGIELLDVLKIRGCMGHPMIAAIGDGGQAGSKEAKRLIHLFVRPDIEELMTQAIQYVFRPLLAANWDLEEEEIPTINAKIGSLNENKAELFAQIIARVSDATHFLPDGRKFKIGTLINIKRLLEDAGIPTLDPDIVSQADLPDDPPSDPGGRPRLDTQKEAQFTSDNPDTRQEQAVEGQ